MNLNRMAVSFLMVIMVVAFLSLSGCASRYLTEEQEAQIKEACGPEHDCYVVKGDVWRKIIQYFQLQMGI